ncbi:MAG: DUF58 domain-containing protein [Chloroflexi bacterium]|nr:DUF58 domain-containing protein [Chloroflexota bacterium]
MNRYRMLLLLLAAVTTGAVGSGRALWWGVAGAIAALLSIAALWSWSSIHWLRISRRSFMRTATVGDVFDEEFRLANLSALPRLWVEVRDHSTLPSHHASRVVNSIGRRNWRGWHVRTLLTRRGRYQLGPVDVRSGDPLGVFQVHRSVPIINTLLVYPYTALLRSFPFPISALPDGEALRRRTQTVTASASGVREYAPGDGIRRIHWPSSARRQRLMVKEFELDPTADVQIVLDLEYAAHTACIENGENDDGLVLPRSSEEYAVSAAASCARFFLEQGRSTGLIAVGSRREIIAADRGERQREHIMETLAAIEANGALSFAYVLATECASLPRGTTLVLISPSTQHTWAEAAQELVHGGVHVVAIAIDPAGFTPPDADTNNHSTVIAALADAGAVVRVLRYGDDLQMALA